MVDAVHLEPVRGGLHHDVGAARVAQLGEPALGVDRLHRGDPSGVGDHAVAVAEIDRGDEAAAQAGRAPGRPQHRRGGGLAVGAGDAGDGERTRRVAVERVGQRAQRQPRVGHTHDRHGCHSGIGQVLGDHGNRSARHGLGGVGVAILAPSGHRDEEGARAQPPAKSWVTAAMARSASPPDNVSIPAARSRSRRRITWPQSRGPAASPRSLGANHDWIGRVLGTISGPCRAPAIFSTTPAASSPR